MSIPFMDLTATNDAVLDEFIESVKEIFASGQFVHGPHVQKLEEVFAKYIGNKQCITVGSGTDAIKLALHALDVRPGDEVIVPAFAYPSTAEAVCRLGANPVFVDVRPDTYTLDPDQTLAKITSRTRAIIPVHLFGQAAEIDRLVTIARTYSVSVVEDVRNAAGARLGNRRVGTYGEFGAFSFHPTNPLGCSGEGGAMTTNDEEKANTVRKLRDHGRNALHVTELVGYNSRLDTIQAAMLLLKLRDLDENNFECIENARLYHRLFAVSPVASPAFADDMSHVYNSYTVLVPDRDKLAEHLKEKGIGHSVPIPAALHMHPCFAYLGYREGAFPISEDLAKRNIALPISPGLKKRQVEEVAETILAFYGVTA